MLVTTSAGLYVLQLTDPCNVERLFIHYSEVFTWAIVEKLNDNSFSVENDQGNLLSDNAISKAFSLLNTSDKLLV